MARYRIASLSAVSIVALWSASVQAQRAAPDIVVPAGVADVATSIDADAAQVGDIVVTAQKRSERINDVPLSITAASGDQLAKVGITDPSQLVRIVPGFTYQLSQYGTPVFGIRGISFFDTSAVAAPAVSVYVDQIPLPLSIMTRGAGLDVERVEVLKGPQGTLFGENATGGAVNYIAAKPTQNLSAGADLTYGRFNQLEAGGFVSASLNDTMAFRLTARTEQRDNWQTSTMRTDRNGKRAFSEGRLLLDWTPSSALRFELNVNGWRDRSDTQAAQFVAYAPTLPPPNGYAPAITYLSAYSNRPDSARKADWDAGFSLKRDDSFYQVSLRSDWDLLSTATLTSLSSYAHYDGLAPADPDGTNYADVRNTLVDDLDVVSQELRIALQTGDIRWLVGGNYEYQKLQETGVNFLQGTNTQFFGIQADQQRSINDQRVNTYAGFGGLDWKVSRSIGLQASIRYTQQDRSYNGCSADGGNGRFALAFGNIATLLSGKPTTIAPGQCISLDAATGLPSGLIHRSLNDNNLSWHIGADWKPRAGLLLYAGVTKGYKAGGFSTLPIGFTDQVTSVRQEAVLAYETGIKATLFNGRVQANAAAFHYDYDDKQIAGSVLVPPFGVLPAVVNVPRSRINGAELSVTAQPIRSIKLSGSLTYVNSKVTRHFATSNPFGAFYDIYGSSLPTAPKWQAYGDAEYDFKTDGILQPYVGGSVNYQAANDAIFDNTGMFRLPARTLLDLRAGVQARSGKWDVQVFAHNVTNKYYWINVAHTVDTVAKYAGLPATYGIRLRYRFE